MLDIKYIRENLNEVKKSTLSKNCDVNFDDIIDLDVKRREVIKTVEKLKSERNILNQNISSLIKNKEDASSIILDMKNISQKIKELDQNLTKTNAELNEKILYVPNNIHPTVPIGKDESSNVVIREWGQKPEFNYEIKDHKSLSETNKLIDFKRGAKISGSGFPLYTNNGAKLERA
ncbi:MAG: serine--tRNA ligase, partial [Gammaproteobacteria bacterium]|nr:serine--tRNA ligase [Gammaproteobacteria bacterium]